MARLCRPALIVLLLIAALPPWAVAQSVLEDRLFKVDGVTLFLRCGGTRGPGLPVVVMETSSRAHADAWDAVHEPIAEMSRACAVDRPGNGRSGPAPGDLTARGYIDLLQTLLRGAGEDPPYAFVGHSLGGMIARLYALTYAADVAGILLIEPTHETSSVGSNLPPSAQGTPWRPAAPARAVSRENASVRGVCGGTSEQPATAVGSGHRLGQHQRGASRITERNSAGRLSGRTRTVARGRIAFT